VNTPYGQGVLVGMKDAFAQVRLRWGGLMSIAQSKITPHQSHLSIFIIIYYKFIFLLNLY